MNDDFVEKCEHKFSISKFERKPVLITQIFNEYTFSVASSNKTLPKPLI